MSRAPRLVYVSCNPESAARDVALLVKAGWRAIRSPTFAVPSRQHSTFIFPPSLNRLKSASCFAQSMAFAEPLLFSVPFVWRPCFSCVLENCAPLDGSTLI